METIKINQLERQLDNLTIKRSIWDRLFNNVDYDEISDISIKLSNLYKIKGDLDKVIHYLKLAIHYNNKSPYAGERNDLYSDLAKHYMYQDNFEMADKYMNKAILVCQESGNFHRAAALTFDIANLYEEKGDIDKSIELMELVIETYPDNVNSTRLQKLADHHIQIENYLRASQIYEIILKDKKTLKCMMSEYIVSGLLCCMCYDFIAAKRFYEKYSVDINDSYHNTFCNDLIESYSNLDSARMRECIRIYDSYKKLTEQRTHMLLMIVRQVENELC